MTLILHDIEYHEDSYKVRLLLGLMGIAPDRVPRGTTAIGPGAPDHPDADLPCLRDGELVVRGAEAILGYLARRYDWRDRWLPADDPVLFGETLTWLSFASRRLRAVGLVDPIFGLAPDDPDETIAARAAFRFLDEHLMVRGLERGPWLVGRTPTVADVAAFPAVAMSAAAGHDLDAYPALRRWMQAMRGLPGFVEVPEPSAAEDVRLSPPRRLARAVRGTNVVLLPAVKQRTTDSAA